MNKPDALTLVIFGASGDLTRRKLMPALYLLYKAGRLPRRFAVLGMARTSYDDDRFRTSIREGLLSFVRPDEVDEKAIQAFLSCLHYLSADPSEPEAYAELKTRLEEIDRTIDNPHNYLYYLATPPLLYGVIPRHLKAEGLNREDDGFRRIVVEKPFGYDLSSALELNRIYLDAFREEQIYRIDHFLGKETVQNILALRFANSVFEPLWNRNYIDYVEITAVENMGIGTRGGFYDGVGTLRDMVQNHLAQLLAVTAMEPPAAFDASGFRNEVVKVYQSLTPLTGEDIRHSVVRGQYMASEGRKGYREEEQVPALSRTETYLAMRLELNNWRWGGVPFYIRTGKQMPTKVSEIVIHFKSATYSLFLCEGGTCTLPNRLVIRIQPNEGIVLRLGMKKPGEGFEVLPMDMDFSYAELGRLPTEDAYARLIEDCIAGDPTLFIRSDAVESGWRFFDPILKYWQDVPECPLYGYPAGSWGPLEADSLVARQGASWTNPCKNLTNTHLYCEL